MEGMNIGGLVIQVLFFVGIGVVIFFVMRRRGGKPKEMEARLVKKTDQKQGGTLSIAMEFELKDGKRKSFVTNETHYAKLEEGRVGMLAFRGRSFIDFEMYDRHVRM